MSTRRKITVTLSDSQFKALGAAVSEREQVLMEQGRKTEAESLLRGWEKIRDEWSTTQAERIALRQQSVIEDATFLAEHGVGATEAARRLGYPTVNALEKHLYNLKHSRLYIHLLRNERRDLAETG